jgi:hypothetical protein
MNEPSPILLPTQRVDAELIQDVRVGLPVETADWALLVINGRTYTLPTEHVERIRALLLDVQRIAALRAGALLPGVPQ